MLINSYRYVKSDPYLNNVSLLLHGNEPNGSTSITDSSPRPKTITNVNSITTSSAQGKWGNSIAFTNLSGYIFGNSSETAFNGNDFTVEMWLRLNNVNTNQSFYDTVFQGSGARNNGFVFVMQNDGRLNVFSSGSFRGKSTNSIIANQWQHVALCRSGNNWYYFIDGIQSGSFTHSVSITDQYFLIGKLGDSNDYFINGYADDIRITANTARYLSSFAVPSAQFPSS